MTRTTSPYFFFALHSSLFQSPSESVLTYLASHQKSSHQRIKELELRIRPLTLQHLVWFRLWLWQRPHRILAETGWKTLLWLNCCERKTLFWLKKEAEQAKYGVSRTGPELSYLCVHVWPGYMHVVVIYQWCDESDTVKSISTASLFFFPLTSSIGDWES